LIADLPGRGNETEGKRPDGESKLDLPITPFLSKRKNYGTEI